MAKTSTSGRIFENALRELSENIVWNNKYKGDMYDQAEYIDHTMTDIYMSGARYLLMFYTQSLLEIVEDYTNEEYINRHLNTITNMEHIRYWDMFFYGVDLSPYAAEGKFATNAERYSTPKYVEKNKYYRELYGLPDYTKPELGHILDYPVDTNNIETTEFRPIYELSTVVKYKADRSGFIKDVEEKVGIDHDYDFVKHITKKRIHPFISRLAGRFELLYVPETELNSLSSDFRSVYEECTTFMIYHYYTDAYRNQYPEYEGFIAMSILLMTMQRMHAKYLEADMTRDFYDLDSIKVVYEAYSVPFFESIPIAYHSKIIKAINKLISFKGSDKVFKEIFALFGFNTMNLYQYYIHKRYKYDSDGKPIFIYKDEVTGELDSRKMFDISFVKGDIGKNPYIYLVDSNNDINYDGVTAADPYWVNDGPLYDKLYDSDYNFIETKYIGVELVFSLTRFILESGYFMRLLLDNRESTSNLYVSHGKLGIDIDIYTLVIYINAIVCRQLGVRGDLASIFEDPTKLSAIYGYNFIEDLQSVYSFISKQYLYNNNFYDANSAEIEKALTNTRSFFMNLSIEDRLFEDFVEGKAFTLTYHKQVCCYCDRPLYGTGIKHCQNPDCCAYMHDVNADDNDFILTKYNAYTTYDNKFVTFYDRYFEDKEYDYMEFRAQLSKYVNRESDIIPQIMYETQSLENGIFDAYYAQRMRARKCALDYISRDLEYLPDPALMWSYTEFVTISGDIEIAKRFIHDKFNDNDYTFEELIRDFFLNNNFIKTNKWGYEDGMYKGRDAQVLIETYAHRTIETEILKILREDMKLRADQPSGSISDINASYHAIKDLRDTFTKLLWRVKDPKTFNAVRRIEKMLMTTRYSEDIYKKSDGTLAATYMDLLEDLNPLLAMRIQDMGEKQLLAELEYSLIALQKLADDLLYIQNYGSTNTNKIIEYIYSLIKFFKSAKAELIDFNTEFAVDGKSTNLIKLMCTNSLLKSERYPTPDEWSIFDYVQIESVNREIDSENIVNFDDYNYLESSYVHLQSPSFFVDAFTGKCSAEYSYTDQFSIFDILSAISREPVVKNSVCFKDRVVGIYVPEND